MHRKTKKVKLAVGKMDRKLLFSALTLTLIGLVAVADASAPSALSTFSDKYYFLKQQAVWSVIGIGGLIVTSHLNYKLWSKVATPLFGITVILLIMVLIPYFAPNLLGARRWIVIGGFTFQPSELAKITLIMYLAKVAESNKKAMSYFVPIGLVAGLIMLEPDLGTTIVLVIIGFSQIFIAGQDLIKIFITGVVAFCMGLLLIVMSPYRKDRLVTFLEQTADPLGKGYHIRQILYALGSGGMFGVGLGQSRQKYLFLPEAANDSIFAVIAEEVGFVGALILISIIVYFVIRGIKIAYEAPDIFSRVLAIGIVAWIGGQAFVNIAAMVSLVPLTGIPLPFISYGGSSLTAVLTGTGILLNISKFANVKTQKRRIK
ncbi:putative lipid II flippase FtsW [Candidatus Woesebacteria bacterium]|nr:MAG: putative lipid II flippase FtsW [Candidatus Woesebacteria bacterium]